MLVNHPRMSVSELPPHQATWHTLPTAWGQVLSSRMGAAMQYSPKYMHWFGKLDGHCIHIRKSKQAEHYWIEHIANDTEAVAEAIQQELNNGTIIITATPHTR